MANLSPLFNAIANTDANGAILALGKIYSYQAGSTTPQQTFSDPAGLIPNTDPIILGTDGKILGNLWLSENLAYKFVLQTAASVQVATYDNISGVITATPATQLLPTGIVLMWSGSIGSIPTGWTLCNGSNGSPDLRNRFVVGAGDLYPVATTGGNKDAIVVMHNHTATSTVVDPGHTHTPGSISNANIDSGTSDGASVQNPAPIPSAMTGITVGTVINPQGVSGVNANLVPYYSLCYIFKL